MRRLLIAEAFATGFIASLRTQHNLWHLRRIIDRGHMVYGDPAMRIWHLWV